MFKMPRKAIGRARAIAIQQTRNMLLNGVFPAADRFQSTFIEPSLAPLHRRIREHLKAQSGSWANEYTAGYPYQGYGRIRVMGARPVEARFARYEIEEYFSPATRALDIGSNTGFLALHVAGFCDFVDGVELNPYLVEIGRDTQKYLGIRNVEFYCVAFEEFDPVHKYDVVFSFANHHTIDGNLDMGFRQYIERVHSFIKPDGMLFFETHNIRGPGLGGPGDDGDLDAKFDVAEQYFEVVKYKMVPVGRHGIQDIDRLFVVLRRKEFNPEAKRTLNRVEAMQRWDYC